MDLTDKEDLKGMLGFKCQVFSLEYRVSHFIASLHQSPGC